MKRIMGTIKKRGTSPGVIPSAKNPVLPQGDSPAAIIVREVTAFCESGAPNSQTAGEEFLHLPAIVDNAESSPAAAKDAAACIRRYLSKENYQRGFAQYNAIMLTRILTDNPARLFTQNFDKQFVATVKELLRDGKDMSVQQILRETLDYIEAEKLKTNETLTPLVEMWRKEKSKSARIYGNFANGPRNLQAPPFDQYQRNSRHSGRPRGLPPPDELAARIEEAKTTARLLLQTIQSTPTSELLSNDLVKEFAERASAAHRSIQQYMSSENPHPDEDTMLTLIETNEQLNIAMSKHQRSILQARKAMGVSTPSPVPQTQSQPGQGAYFPPQNAYGAPPPQPQRDPYGQPAAPMQSAYGQPAPPATNFYDQQASSKHESYSQASPNSPNMYDAPGSPQRATSGSFRPPSGPPPGARGAVRSSGYGSPSPPPIPSRNRPMSGEASDTQTAQYGVSENPFSDDAAAAPPPQSDSLHDSMPRNGEQPEVGRPAAPYGGTPSYMHRQDSAMNNLTMHGASPPPGEQGLQKNPSPVSPIISDTRAIQARMGNLNLQT